MSNTPTAVEGQLTLTNVRLSFPALFKAEGIKNDPSSKPRYGATFLVSKTDAKTVKAIGDEIKRLEAKHFKGKALADKDICFHDGDQQSYDGYEGTMYLAANRSEKQGRPTVVDRDKTPLAESDNRPYAGCYVNAVVRFYVPKDWKKVCCSLEIVQFLKDGDTFGAPRADLDTLPDEIDDEDL